MVLGAWCLVLGAWCLVLGAWCGTRWTYTLSFFADEKWSTTSDRAPLDSTQTQEQRFPSPIGTMSSFMEEKGAHSAG
ncbi:hypothetical protein EIM46_19785 [Xanthomonas vasicola pv. musacearum]|nr:hypothetical protein EIM46_19785 [Xanthomonas vasicola pv. musacearum]